MMKTPPHEEGATVLMHGPYLQGKLPRPAQHQGGRHHHELREYNVDVVVYDPWPKPHEAEEEYGLQLTPLANVTHADAVIAAVAHTEFKTMDISALARVTGPNTPFMDVKSVFNRSTLEQAGFSVWRL
jgi:UDP-N-acetyl-D-galactosamine dehydrogenase